MQITESHSRVPAVVIVLAAAGIAIFAVREYRGGVIERACIANLHAIYRALESYADDNHGYYPRVPNQAGRLMFGSERMYSSDFSPISLIAPLAPKARHLREQALQDPVAAFDDRSYWYLGYCIVHERSGMAWIEAYRQFVLVGQPIEQVNEIWPDCEPAIEARREARRLEYEQEEQRHFERRILGIAEAEEPMLKGVLITYAETRFYRPLKWGVDGFLIQEVHFPTRGTKYQALIPVVIERPELHGDGGHVLYMDGHVEFVPYPGKFPMTEKFIEGLRALDALEGVAH